MDDFKYANQFVGRLIPQKLSDDVLGAIKSALINFAMGMIAAGLLLGIATGLGALIGALIGVLPVESERHQELLWEHRSVSRLDSFY